MWPRYRSGEYVVVATGQFVRSLFFKSFVEGRDVVFRDAKGDLMLKRLGPRREDGLWSIRSLNPEAPELPDVAEAAILGAVVWLVKGPRAGGGHRG